jgi:hypothetical protein
VWGITRHLPRASSTTISTTRLRSSFVSAQNTPIVPVQKMPSIASASV